MQIMQEMQWLRASGFQQLPPCTPCTFALSENAKVPKMPRVNIGILSLPNTVFLTELTVPLCKSAKNARGDNEKTIRYGNEKRLNIRSRGKIPFEFLKRLCMLPTVG